MHDLAHTLRWRLLKGPHEFPGPDGGTCINEAALVVAGFPYRKVSGQGDLPTCFSRPISAYALRLNDDMPCDLRQELLTPFVVRLAGTADTEAVERQRADLIVVRTVTDILPIILRLRHLNSDLAVLCESAKTNTDAYAAANKARGAAAAAAYAADAYGTDAAASAAYAAAADAAASAAYAAAADDAAAASAAAAAADAAASAAAADQRKIWLTATSILDAALQIGRQAEPIETALILSRAEKAKRRELVTA